MSNSLCQLATDWRGVPRGRYMNPMIVEQKIDGFRAMFMRDVDGKPSLFSRNGAYIHGTEHIIYQCLQLERIAGEKLFIDGEFQVDGTLAATKAWFERGWKQGGTAGTFCMFDCLPYADWKQGGSSTPLIDRKRRLHNLLWMLERDPAAQWDWRAGSHGQDEGRMCVTLLPETWAYDTDDVLSVAQAVWKAGGEGVMLKDPFSPYQKNRNRAWQKVKQENKHKWQDAA